MAGTVAAYLFRDGYDDVTRQVQLLAEAAGRRDRAVAADDGRDGRSRAAKWRSLARLPDAVDGVRSVAAVRAHGGLARPVGAPARPHRNRRARPALVRAQARRIRRHDLRDAAGRARGAGARDPSHQAGWTRRGAYRLGLRRSAARQRDAQQALRADRREGRSRDVEHTNADGTPLRGARGRRTSSTAPSSFSLFGNTVTLFDVYDWNTGEPLTRRPFRSRSGSASSSSDCRMRSRSSSAARHPRRRLQALLRRRRRALPHHRARGAGDGAGARALDHELSPRALHGHGARAPGRLHAPHQHQRRRISSASWRGRSTR